MKLEEQCSYFVLKNEQTVFFEIVISHRIW